MAALASLGALALLLLSSLSCCSALLKGTNWAHFLPLGNAGSSLGLLSPVAGARDPFISSLHALQAAPRLLSAEDAFSKLTRAMRGSELRYVYLPTAEACVEPQITPSYYTTSDAVISTETVFIVEISLTCKNRVQNMALYADVSGKQFPVTRGQDVGRYQVSWSLDHKSAHAGTYEVRFFDEESYSLLRKAQRNNEDISIIPPLFTVSVDHRGTWNGPWVSTEVLAAAIGLVIYYLAFSAKSHIQA